MGQGLSPLLQLQRLRHCVQRNDRLRWLSTGLHWWRLPRRHRRMQRHQSVWCTGNMQQYHWNVHVCLQYRVHAVQCDDLSGYVRTCVHRGFGRALCCVAAICVYSFKPSWLVSCPIWKLLVLQIKEYHNTTKACLRQHYLHLLKILMGIFMYSPDRNIKYTRKALYQIIANVVRHNAWWQCTKFYCHQEC